MCDEWAKKTKIKKVQEFNLIHLLPQPLLWRSVMYPPKSDLPVVPHKAVAEVSKIGNL